MDDVKRWEPISDRGEGRCVQSPDGEYVEHHDYAALLARLDAVTQERDAACEELMAAQGQIADAQSAQARAEKAEAAFAGAYRAGVEDALDRINDFNTLPPDESGHRWRESDLLDQEVMSIRALPDKTPAEILAQIEERGE